MKRKNELKALVGVSIALVLVAMAFGLWPRGFDFSNRVSCLTDLQGIQFGKFGIAYTMPISEWGSAYSPPKEFSIEIALKALSSHKNGFGFILAVHGSSDKDQLIMGQWRSWLIVMNGDDYDHRRRTKRIAAKLASDPPGEQLVTITTGSHGTRIYIDGQLIAEQRDLILTIPAGQGPRLFLGNSPDGRHGWRGLIGGLAWYDYVLGHKEVQAHFRRWAKDRNFIFAKQYHPFLLYLFNEELGKRAIDHGFGRHDLRIPVRMAILEKKILSLKWSGRDFDSGFLKDAFVNLVGFIPLGFVFMMTLVKRQGSARKWHIGVVVFLCFSIGLAIEILQAWIPSRSSDCTDLLLNTLGGLVGAMIFHYL